MPSSTPKHKTRRKQGPRRRRDPVAASYHAELNWQGQDWTYQVIHSERRSLAIQVHRDGRLVVRAPQGLSADWVARWVESKSVWIAGKRQQLAQRFPLRPPLQYVAGAQHHFLGRPFTLTPVLGSGRSRWDHQQLQLACRSLEESVVAAALQTWYRRQAREIFPQRLEQCWPVFAGLGLRYPTGLRVRQMKTLWGSMTQQRVMTLNLKLIRAPEALIDYVVFHELCHLRYYHHGPEFHALMTQVLPDWRVRKRQLESLGL